MIKKLLLTLIITSLSISASMAVDGVSLDPSQNLFSARQLGMAGLSLAFSDDANGVFTNPADTTEIKFPQLTALSRKIVFGETQYSLLSWMWPTNFGTFGLGYVTMGTAGSLATKLDPATGRIIINPSIEATDYSNTVMAISYARKVRQNLSLGGNLKFFNQSLSGGTNSKATGMGLDLTALLKARPWLTVGANLQNVLEPSLKWENGTSDKIGGFYKLGCQINVLGASHEALRTNKQELNAGIDIDLPHSNLAGSNYHLGLEYFPQEKIALRTGIDQNFGLTFGVGLTNGGFRFDYAYAARSGIPGDVPHYFSLSYVGERTVTKSEKLYEKIPDIKFLQPEDKTLTDAATIPVTIETKAKRVMDETTIWAVTAISETKEVNKLVKKENLANASFNGIAAKGGIIETISQLQMGRNVLKAYGYTSPEAQAPEPILGTGEARVLRYTPFTDLPATHWALRPIVLCNTLKLVKGFPGNSFKPDKGITRAELVTLLVRTMPVDIDLLSSTTLFTDVKETHWAAKYITYGAEKGLVHGYPNGTFAPNRVLNRAEGVTILARYSGLSEEVGTDSSFLDLAPDYWANKYIYPAQKAGLLKYLVGKDFEPTSPFTRAEACEVLYQTDKIQKQVDYFWDTGNLLKDLPAKTIISTEEVIPITAPSTVEAIPSTTLSTAEAIPSITTTEVTPSVATIEAISQPVTQEAIPTFEAQ